MSRLDCAVIGAGVVGLAVARAVARGGRSVLLLEHERHFGMHTSSRNSEVIHAGIHYAPGSLKARLCVTGKELLYRYCEAHQIAHQRCGKLTVADGASQVPALATIEANARANGVEDLEWWEATRVRSVEPALHCHVALHSPSTGIIDSHGYMLALLAEAEACGADVIYGTRVSALRPSARGIDVLIDGEREPAVRVGSVVNAAGLSARAVAACVDGFPAAQLPRIRYAKGNYFALAGASPFKRLVYPVGEHGWLGVHMTLDLAGAARFGPDLQWIDAIDYAVDESRREDFYASIRRYWPGLQDGRLLPAYAGIRPKLTGPGEAAADFLIQGAADHGIPGLVNLFGIESPGLTASLALGEQVAAMLA